MTSIEMYEIALKLYYANKIQEAKEAFIYCLQVDAKFFHARFMLGNIFLQENNYKEAIVSYKQAIQLNPSFTLTYNNLASIFTKFSKHKKALKYLNKALKQNINCTQTLYNLANYYKGFYKLKKSKAYLKKIIEIDSSFTLAHFDLSYIYFIEKKYEKAFESFEYRVKLKDQQHKYNYLPFQIWEKQDIKEKSLLIYHEQGFGDNIQFSRYLNNKKLNDTNVSYAIQNSLNKLFSYSFPKITFLSEVQSNMPFDYTIPIMSLAHQFQMSTIKKEKKYLKVKKSEVKKFKKKNLRKRKFNIGLVWKGSQTQIGDKKRSLILSNFTTLLKDKHLKFYSLQIDNKKELNDFKEIKDLGKKFCDFYDTAVAIEALDLVISVDTAVAHLCGALGKTCFVLHNQNVVDFRWAHDNSKSLWYQSIKIFKYDLIDDIQKKLHKDVIALSKT